MSEVFPKVDVVVIDAVEVVPVAEQLVDICVVMLDTTAMLEEVDVIAWLVLLIMAAVELLLISAELVLL